jgi:hypothetical protein
LYTIKPSKIFDFQCPALEKCQALGLSFELPVSTSLQPVGLYTHFLAAMLLIIGPVAKKQALLS